MFTLNEQWPNAIEILIINDCFVIPGHMVYYNCSDLVLLGLEEVHKTHSDFLPDMKDVTNFGKRREYAKVILELQRHQTYPYNLCPIDVS